MPHRPACASPGASPSGHAHLGAAGTQVDIGKTPAPPDQASVGSGLHLTLFLTSDYESPKTGPAGLLANPDRQYTALAIYEVSCENPANRAGRCPIGLFVAACWIKRWGVPARGVQANHTYSVGNVQKGFVK